MRVPVALHPCQHLVLLILLFLAIVVRKRCSFQARWLLLLSFNGYTWRRVLSTVILAFVCKVQQHNWPPLRSTDGWTETGREHRTPDYKTSALSLIGCCSFNLHLVGLCVCVCEIWFLLCKRPFRMGLEGHFWRTLACHPSSSIYVSLGLRDLAWPDRCAYTCIQGQGWGNGGWLPSTLTPRA